MGYAVLRCRQTYFGGLSFPNVAGPELAWEHGTGERGFLPMLFSRDTSVALHVCEPDLGWGSTGRWEEF